MGDETVKIWDMSGRLLHTLQGHKDDIRACAISHDSTTIITGSDNEIIKIWHAVSGTELGQLRPTQQWSTFIVRECAISPDDRFFITTRDRTIKIWDLHHKMWKRDLFGANEQLRTCAISPNGKWIVAGGDGKLLYIWNIQDETMLPPLAGHQEMITRCAFSPDSAYVVTSESEWEYLAGVNQQTGTSLQQHRIIIWNVGNWSIQAQIFWKTHEITGCTVTPDARYVIATDISGHIKVWDIIDGHELATFKNTIGSTLFCLALHPWEPIIAGGGESGELILAQLKPIEYGPIVVTARNFPQGMQVRCPRCQHSISISQRQLGAEIPCSQCMLSLRITSFAITIDGD